MSNGDGGSAFSCGLLLGAAVGAMGALLLAPKSGAEIRYGLIEGRRRLRQTRERTLAELRESGQGVHEAYEKALGALYDAVDDVKEAARSVVETEPPPALEERPE